MKRSVALAAAVLPLAAAPLAAVPPSPQCSGSGLEPSVPQVVSSMYGQSVAASGDRALVGAMLNGCPLPYCSFGSVWFFERRAGVWTEVQRFAGAAGDFLGARSAAIDGDVAVVGVPYDGSAHGPGYAAVFENVGGQWRRTARLVPSVLAPWLSGFTSELRYARFGYSVDVEGTRIVVGAPHGPAAAGKPGLAFVFERRGGAWGQTAILAASDSTPSDRFGTSVSLSMGRLAVGAPLSDQPLGAGAAYVYEHVAGEWRETAIVPNSQLSSGFAYALSLSGSRLVVSALSQARVHVFAEGAAGWVLEALLRGHDTRLDDAFGESVRLQGDRLVVGAPRGSSSVGQDAGAAYYFERAASGWRELAKMEAFAAGPVGRRFGAAVALAPDAVLVGAPSAGPGAAYVFERSGPAGAPLCAGAPNSTGSAAELELVGCAFLAIDELALVLGGLPPGMAGVPLASRDVDVVFGFGGGQGVLCLAQPYLRLRPFAAGASGSATVPLPLGVFPGGAVPQPGETWYFQVWYRDANPASTSNLSSAVELVLR